MVFPTGAQIPFWESSAILPRLGLGDGTFEFSIPGNKINLLPSHTNRP